MCDRFLSVLVVNYNGAAYLPACLDALETQTLAPDRFEVIVLDNASADRSVEIFRLRYSWVKLVESERNLGFAEGNNVAGSHARGSYWVLLNPDTVPDPFWLEEVDRAIDENVDAVIACKLVLADDPSRLNSAGLFLMRDGRGADRGFRQVDDGRYDGGGEVFAGCAAALAVPAPLAGEPLFDPRLFLYGEDLDLGWRGQLAGRRTVFAPRAVVRHAVGMASGDESPVFWFHAERNRSLVALKLADPFSAVVAAGGLMLRAIRAVGLAIVRHPAPKYSRPNALAVVRAVFSYLRHAPAVLRDRFARP